MMDFKMAEWPTADPGQADRFGPGDREEILCALESTGALRIRGVARSIEAFEALVTNVEDGLMAYTQGNSPRSKLGRKVYTSTEYPADQPISLHNEMSYAAVWPQRLWLCCLGEPIHGGETPLADSRQILNKVPQAIVDEFERRGLCYIQNLPNESGFGRSWQKAFETMRRDVVESHCRATDTALEWKPDGGVRLIQRRPATLVHPRTGFKVWFNQAEQWHPSALDQETREALEDCFSARDLPHNVLFADGGCIPDDWLDVIREVQSSQELVEPWRFGDVVLIDNVTWAHGRRPFDGPRQIAVALSGPYQA